MHIPFPIFSLPALLLAGVLCVLPGCAGKRPAPAADTPLPMAQADGLHLLLLHTNDTHAHVAGIDTYGNACFEDKQCRGGYARIAAALRKARAEHDNVIALDAGDQFQGTLFFTVNNWPMLAALDRHLPYDAMTFGNHEFDINCRAAAHFAAGLPFPLLAANLAPQEGCALRGGAYVPYLVREVRGQKVGIVGLANDEVGTVANACPQTTFTEAQTALRKAVAELSAQGVKHIIALTHLGLERDRELARSVDGVDVVVGGHSHSYLGDNPAEKSPEGPYPVVEHSPNGGKVLVVTAKRATQYLGELAVGFDREGRVVAWQGAARELGVDAPRDPEVSRLVARYAKPLKAYRERKAGVVETAATLPDGLDECRLGECRTALIMVDAFLEYARPFGAQVALVPGGCVRAALPRGAVTVGDVLQTMPFGNTLVVRELTGAQLKQALEQGVAADAASRPALLQPAGLAYTVDTRQPAGKRVSRVVLVDGAGEESPLDPAKSYRVVFISYLARGGDGHTVLQEAKTVPSAEETELVALERYLKAHSPLTQLRTGRIRWVR